MRPSGASADHSESDAQAAQSESAPESAPEDDDPDGLSAYEKQRRANVDRNK